MEVFMNKMKMHIACTCTEYPPGKQINSDRAFSYKYINTCNTIPRLDHSSGTNIERRREMAHDTDLYMYVYLVKVEVDEVLTEYKDLIL